MVHRVEYTLLFRMIYRQENFSFKGNEKNRHKQITKHNFDHGKIIIF
jgi:hypothetical protein